MHAFPFTNSRDNNCRSYSLFTGASSDGVCVFVLHASRLPSRRKAEVSAPVAESSEARQKFANAKAISSDMFFGRESSADVRNLVHDIVLFIYSFIYL